MSRSAFAADGEWRRVHPVTPLVRGWAVVAALLFVVGQQSLDDLPSAGEWAGRLWWQLLVALAVVSLVAFGYAALAWRMTAYAVDGESVRLHSGIVLRQQRRARLDRLQAVDVVQPLVARLFGLAEVKIEVAGGSGSGIRLGYLTLAEAERLRAELLARAAGVTLNAGSASHSDSDGRMRDGAATTDDDPEIPAAPEAPERPVTHVPPGRLVGSIVASVPFGFAVLGIVVCVGVVIGARELGALVTAVPVLIGFGGLAFRRFTGEYGFQSAISPDGIRLRHGLLESRSQTIPPGRVQALRLSQGPLWRRQDWWRVDINVAGYAADWDSGHTSTNQLLPVGLRDDALVAVWLVLPDLGAADPRGLLFAALTGSGPGESFVVSPRRARWADPLAWSRTGVAVTDRALIIRHGRIVRRVTIVPHERTQSLAVQQGPWQRLLGLATLAVHSTPGPFAPSVPHLAASDAAALLEQQAARARVARAQEGPELWMRRDEVPS